MYGVLFNDILRTYNFIAIRKTNDVKPKDLKMFQMENLIHIVVVGMTRVRCTKFNISIGV